MGSSRRVRSIPQTDADGVPYVTLPPIVNSWANPPAVDTRFPSDLPNEPFLIEDYVPLGDIDPSPTHRFYQHQLQVNGGRMDRYVVWSDTGGLPLGHFDTEKLPLYPYAREHTLCDNFFTAAWGGSMLNHIWLIAATTPLWPGAPADQIAQPIFDSGGALIGLQQDGNVTPDGYCVNDVQPFYAPFQAGTPVEERMPPQLAPTIGDRLSDAGVSWAWYAGGWDDAVAGNPAPTFEFHHQPFSYFSRYGEGMPGRQHLQDETRFLEQPHRGNAAGRLIHQAARHLRRARRLLGGRVRREPRRRADRSGESLPILGAIGNRRDLRRFRRLVRPRRPAAHRPLGARRPGASHHRLALGAQGVR